MRFAGFLYVQIFSWNAKKRFVNFAVHFIRMRSSLILNCSSGPFFLYYTICWSGSEKEGKKRIMGEGEWQGKSVFNNPERAIKCIENQHTQIDTYMPSRITTQHKNSLQLTHLYIKLSPSLIKNIYRQNLKLALQKNGHDKKDIIKIINKQDNGL